MSTKTAPSSSSSPPLAARLGLALELPPRADFPRTAPPPRATQQPSHRPPTPGPWGKRRSKRAPLSILPPCPNSPPTPKDAMGIWMPPLVHPHNRSLDLVISLALAELHERVLLQLRCHADLVVGLAGCSAAPRLHLLEGLAPRRWFLRIAATSSCSAYARSISACLSACDLAKPAKMSLKALPTPQRSSASRPCCM